MAAGVVAGRLVGRFGAREVLTTAMLVQGLATLPLVLLTTDRMALAVLVPALFAGFFGHVAAIVAYTVTGTSGLPDEEQGLATGLTTMTQQVAVSVGIPILSAVAATQSAELTGIRLALGVNVTVTLISVGLVWIGLRPRRGQARPHRHRPAAEQATATAEPTP
ncbi:MFS transporter [Actinomadura kijaniata]|uniref:MFS transporter n=1 Tax=Actinomadura kijaniata TaxID=46161 RepID=UPI003F1CF359